MSLKWATYTHRWKLRPITSGGEDSFSEGGWIVIRINHQRPRMNVSYTVKTECVQTDSVHWPISLTNDGMLFCNTSYWSLMTGCKPTTSTHQDPIQYVLILGGGRDWRISANFRLYRYSQWGLTRRMHHKMRWSVCRTLVSNCEWFLNHTVHFIIPNSILIT